MKLSLRKYKLIIFDWDGTLVDSLDSYKLWDKAYTHKFYGVDLPLKYFEDLAKEKKVISVGDDDNVYFRFLDTEHGDGSTPMSTIWENVYSVASEIQSKIRYQENAPEALRLLALRPDLHLALATNATTRDIEYFSSDASLTAQSLAPLRFFETIVTVDQIASPKPHPETFTKVIDYYDVALDEVLIFEDSSNGIMAAKATGADVVAIFAESEASKQADFVMDSWSDLLAMLNKNVT